MNLFEKQQKEFLQRHLGPNEEALQEMLQTIKVSSVDELIDKTIPASIRINRALDIPKGMSESAYLDHISNLSKDNEPGKSYLGQGYYGTLVPSVIARNVFENPGWYTQYTPYQAEISQGRLESLLNYQTVVSDLTGLPIANASLLDEGTAAAEAMAMFFSVQNRGKNITRPKLFVDEAMFPQTKDIIITRANPLGIEVVFSSIEAATLDETYFGVLIQYPNDQGEVVDYKSFINTAKTHGIHVGMATDLLALTLLESPGVLGADAAFGSAQRFGVPMGFGGPHAAFFSIQDEFKRHLPGRIIGVSVDTNGDRALRMALQTREQHIKRERATSNICTAQALLANMAAMYAVYHGPKGLTDIATRVQLLTANLKANLEEEGIKVLTQNHFDTLQVEVADAAKVRVKAEEENIHLRYFGNQPNLISISLDETTTLEDIANLINVITLAPEAVSFSLDDSLALKSIPSTVRRISEFLEQEVFNSYHSETQMMRYIKFLENKDLSLNTSMIPLGSCTMKLNAATEMMPLSQAGWSNMHPFMPTKFAKGYLNVLEELETLLCEITGFAGFSLQPNSGASGEYAGLLAIRDYHASINESHRNIMLIPISAHGTNPASAVMAGYKVVVVKSLDNGNIDVEDLKAKAEKHQDNLGGIMITYPSTYGIFEESVKEIISIIHENGGQVYMDGANMNAQSGLTGPGYIGADVCHLNLHKTFAIPHGGGGPGMGPIGVAAHLIPFIPGHLSWEAPEFEDHARSVSAAPYGSASILLISYAYIRLLGAEGVKRSTELAIVNANYMKTRLEGHYDILYSGANGTCAHEFIVDLRPLKRTAGVEAEDVAKRLMDYGFHAPTMSFPVAGTIMIEPTESEDKAELDRYCDALIQIREEIRAIEEERMDAEDNPLKNAPHTQAMVINSEWNHPYSREEAAFPLAFVRNNKFWPSVARVNNSVGDRNLICTCDPIEMYMDAEA